MYRYRSNERLIKKLKGGRKCLLEAMVFATGMHLGELGLAFPAKKLEVGLLVHEINQKLQKLGVFQLCMQQLAVRATTLASPLSSSLAHRQMAGSRWHAPTGWRRR